MKIIGVKHPGCKKIFYFEASDKLANKIEIGDTVICDTAKGSQIAAVAILPFGGDGALDVVQFLGSTLPLKKIISKCKAIEMNNIKIPKFFSMPKTEKLIDRINEYRTYRSFKTRVAVDKNNRLTDGYTAYLVARMFGEQYLVCQIAN